MKCIVAFLYTCWHTVHSLQYDMQYEHLLKPEDHMVMKRTTDAESEESRYH